jgi:hypothetical protein
MVKGLGVIQSRPFHDRLSSYKFSKEGPVSMNYLIYPLCLILAIYIYIYIYIYVAVFRLYFRVTVV